MVATSVQNLRFLVRCGITLEKRGKFAPPPLKFGYPNILPKIGLSVTLPSLLNKNYNSLCYSLTLK